jgi:hypothetical protein
MNTKKNNDAEIYEMTEMEAFEEESTFQDESDNVLRLSDLSRPEALTFELSDGSKIEFIDPADLNPTQYAKFSKLGKLIQKNTDLLEQNLKDESIAKRLDNQMAEFLRMILPDLPADVLNGFAYGKKGQIITWWSKQSDFGDEPKKASNGKRPRV